MKKQREEIQAKKDAELAAKKQKEKQAQPHFMLQERE